MPEENVWIAMRDGVRLAATLYLPDAPPPWPAILEALPYRKDDVTAYDTPEYRRLRDEGGYAVCRLDLRGTGSSEGLATDEYPPYEQQDLCEVIEWLATRDWTTGAVGMYGTSYSGFNSLQVAMERPSALKAIIAIFATDDRYTDDVHYGGGIRRALDLADYPLYMVAMNALPPVPSVFGDGWRDLWRQRIENLEPWLIRWVEEQLDSEYWRHGSLRPNYDRIQCATMIVGGWADGYRNATFRVFENLPAPKRLVMGPWSHTSTETSLPGPRIDLVPEMIRWWDRWLKDGDHGVDKEPPIAVFVRRSTKPAGDLDEMRGEWRYEPKWPPERGRELTLDLAAAHSRRDTAELDIRGDVGPTASIWCAGTLPFGQPLDQRPDGAMSLDLRWPKLESELEILGYPRLELVVASSVPVAYVSAKLCDVWPDGTTALVSRGVLNLAHRDSHSSPRPLEEGGTCRATVELDATSWVFERGHRVALHLASSDWPNVWPPPNGGKLKIDIPNTRLVLPHIGEAGAARSGAPRFNGPRREPARAAASGPAPIWRVENDILAHERSVVIENRGDTELEGGGRLLEFYGGAARVSTDDPGRAAVEARSRFDLQWPEASVGAEARMTFSSDRHSWHVDLELDVSDDGSLKWSRRWRKSLPRALG
ncbi:MAG: CocE/NonD family hydrolase [Actinomycetota bacterium]|nr:CocE/NonD family hydrolase [Actinomycetota bacterium]